jgi:hypothetical protein
MTQIIIWPYEKKQRNLIRKKNFPALAKNYGAGLYGRQAIFGQLWWRTYCYYSSIY